MMHRYTEAQMHRYTDTQIHRHTYTQTSSPSDGGPHVRRGSVLVLRQVIQAKGDVNQVSMQDREAARLVLAGGTVPCWAVPCGVFCYYCHYQLLLRCHGHGSMNPSPVPSNNGQSRCKQVTDAHRPPCGKSPRKSRELATTIVFFISMSKRSCRGLAQSQAGLPGLGTSGLRREVRQLGVREPHQGPQRSSQRRQRTFISTLKQTSKRACRRIVDLYYSVEIHNQESLHNFYGLLFQR